MSRLASEGQFEDRVCAHGLKMILLEYGFHRYEATMDFHRHFFYVGVKAGKVVSILGDPLQKESAIGNLETVEAFLERLAEAGWEVATIVEANEPDEDYRMVLTFESSGN